MLAMALPTIPAEASRWHEALYAFLVEKGHRSCSRRTVESYSRMLWRFFDETTPDRIKPADVLAYAHGIGLSGKPPSAVTIGARIACLSSYSASSCAWASSDPTPVTSSNARGRIHRRPVATPRRR
jgi:hypothetical protein